MKKVWVVLLFLGILVVSAQANLVSNGDFNTGDLTDWWSYSPGDPDQSITVQSVVNYDSTPNAEMISASDGAWQELGTNGFAISAETTYSLSMVYNETGWVGAGINLKYWDADWNEIGYEWIDVLSSASEGTGVWTPYSTEFTTIADAANMEVKIVMGAWGTLYVEDVSVEVPEPATMAMMALGSTLLLRRRKR